jgi:catechol 2,3-dioxygenase-like lactoylglutathione lyase family enzyme
MAGIVFFQTQQIDEMERFYTDLLGMKIWLRQEDCVILKHENLLLGFCRRPQVDNSGVITFFYKTKKEVDSMYDRLKDIARAAPETNNKYHIYRFFAYDPEHRVLEFQYFLHPVDV